MASPTDNVLFEGELSRERAAAMLYFHSRIADAVQAYHKSPPTDQRKARWTVGLYYEIEYLKTAIGKAMMSGCSGGSFFRHVAFDWVQSVDEDNFGINWDTFPPSIEKVVPWSGIVHLIPLTVLSYKKWWTWDDTKPGDGTDRPRWWDVTFDTLNLYFPEQPVARSRLLKADAMLRSSAALLDQFAAMGEEWLARSPAEEK